MKCKQKDRWAVKATNLRDLRATNLKEPEFMFKIGYRLPKGNEFWWSATEEHNTKDIIG